MATIQKRITKDGDVSYRVQVRLRGYPASTATFERLTDARKWGQQTETAIQENRYFKTSQSKKYTLADALDRYEKEILSLRKNPVNQRTYLAYWRSALGDYLLGDLTTSLIAEHRNNLVGRKNRFGRAMGTTTANRYTQPLGHVFNVAMKQWEWTHDNPISRLSKYKEGRGRVRFLSDEERSTLLDACKGSENPHIYNIVVLALSTGARKMELLRLKWHDVDLNRGQLVFHETKNGDRRVAPLKGYALELIKASKRIDGCEYVFPSGLVKRSDKGVQIYQPIDIRTAWENVLIRSGIKDFRFHDLRHSAASYLAMNNASLTEIADILGHRTLQMVSRYAHLSEAHTASVVASMNEKIFGGMVG